MDAAPAQLTVHVRPVSVTAHLRDGVVGAALIVLAACGGGTDHDSGAAGATGQDAGGTAGIGSVAVAGSGEGGLGGAVSIVGGSGNTAASGATGAAGAGTAGASTAGAAGAGTAAGGVTGASGASAGQAALAGAGGGLNSSPTLAVRFADSIMLRWPDPRNITGVQRGWDYNNAIVLRGMLEVYTKTLDPRYRAYIKKYVDSFIDANGNVFIDAAHTARVDQQPHSLDLILPGLLVLFLEEQYPTEPRYQLAATSLRNEFAKFPKNPSGGFWHKQTYPNEMWLDGLYMAEPFLAQFGAKHASCGQYCSDTPVAQIALLRSHVRLGSGLLLHGWDFDHDAAWCTGACAGAAGSGLSPAVWSRALGWFAMALIDVLEFLPPSHAGRPALVADLEELATALKTTQDLNTGLWCQVVDKCGRADDWVESSGSGMFVYALKRGVDRGYLTAEALAVAERGWQGLKSRAAGSDSSGPILTDTAEGMSIQSSYANYVAAAKVANSYHGLCAIQLAATAMEY